MHFLINIKLQSQSHKLNIEIESLYNVFMSGSIEANQNNNQDDFPKLEQISVDITSYLNAIPKIFKKIDNMDASLNNKYNDLNKKYDGINASLKSMETKIDNLGKNIHNQLIAEIGNLFRGAVNNISIECTQKNINKAFYNYEKQNDIIEKNLKSNSSIWINTNLPNFRFAQIKSVIDQMLNDIVLNNKNLKGIILNRDEKRSLNALCNHLDRFWDIVEPKFNIFKGDKLEEIKKNVEEEYNLNTSYCINILNNVII